MPGENYPGDRSKWPWKVNTQEACDDVCTSIPICRSTLFYQADGVSDCYAKQYACKQDEFVLEDSGMYSAKQSE